jgi:rhodanese-related sulfurtransferase
MNVAMKTIIQALLIAVAWGAIGAGTNFFSAKPIPWVYEPPTSLELAGVKVPLIDEKRARELWENSETVFVDSRNQADYSESRVKGSVFLPPDDQERFVSVEPLLPQESMIVLYCYGPECDMAERVALFLVQLGYRNLAIMSSGFAAWEQAGYPVEKDQGRQRSLDSRQVSGRVVSGSILSYGSFLGSKVSLQTFGMAWRFLA